MSITSSFWRTVFVRNQHQIPSETRTFGLRSANTVAGIYWWRSSIDVHQQRACNRCKLITTTWWKSMRVNSDYTVHYRRWDVDSFWRQTGALPEASDIGINGFLLGTHFVGIINSTKVITDIVPIDKICLSWQVKFVEGLTWGADDGKVQCLIAGNCDIKIR